MNRFTDSIRHIFVNHKPLPAGIYDYRTPPDAPAAYRLHLRIDTDGTGILIINAKTVLHLNHTAAEYAYYLVKGMPENEVVGELTRRYRVSKATAAEDYHNLRERIESLIHTPDLDPETFLDFDRRDPYTTALSAPYRLDCALTYQLPEKVTPSEAPVDRVSRELLTNEWQVIIDKAWKAGVPHIIFTGGEPTLRPDLADLIAYAQKIGLVTGLLSDGLRLSNPSYLQSLLQSGLDHLMILLDPGEDQSWEALRAVTAEDLFTTVHLTLTPENQGKLAALLDRLAEMKVKSISLSASDPSLSAALQSTRQYAALKEMSLEWDLPVPYSAFHPVALELAEGDHPLQKGEGSAWLYVEPDGDVLPGQGHPTVMGNLLTDPWEKIWANRPK
jgi:hypothetical protein